MKTDKAILDLLSQRMHRPFRHAQSGWPSHFFTADLYQLLSGGILYRGLQLAF